MGDTDYIHLSIFANCGLEVEPLAADAVPSASAADADPMASARATLPFYVCGPPRAKAWLLARMSRSSTGTAEAAAAGGEAPAAGGDKAREEASKLHCWLSPKASVTVPRKFRKGAGIPLAAHSFAFVYPLPSLFEALSALDLVVDAWAFTLLIGVWAGITHTHTHSARSHSGCDRALPRLTVAPPCGTPSSHCGASLWCVYGRRLCLL